MKRLCITSIFLINSLLLIAQNNAFVLYDYFDSTKTNFIEYREGKKYGFMDIRTKKIIVPPMYDILLERTEKYASVELNGQRGIIDYNNKIKLPFRDGLIHLEERFIHSISPVDGKKQIERHTYHDTNLNFLFSFEADNYSVTSFGSNSIAYSELNKAGRIVDTTGKTLLELPIYITFNNSVYRGYFANIDNNIIILRGQDTISKKPATIRINTNKEVVPFPLDMISSSTRSILKKLSSNLYLVEKRFEDGTHGAGRKNEYYLYDTLGNQLNKEPFFNPIWNFGQRMRIENEKGKYGFVNPEGRLVIPFKYSGNRYIFSEGLVAYDDSTSTLIGFMDTNGVEVIKPKFHWLSGSLLLLTGFYHEIRFKEGLCLVVKSKVTQNNFSFAGLKDYTLCYIDKTGTEKILLAQDIRVAGDFSDGLAPVMNSKGLLGFIDRSGVMVIPFKYKIKQETGAASLPFFYKGFCKINDGYIDKKGYEYFKN